jgi:hypothetical protein
MLSADAVDDMGFPTGFVSERPFVARSTTMGVGFVAAASVVVWSTICVVGKVTPALSRDEGSQCNRLRMPTAWCAAVSAEPLAAPNGLALVLEE